MTWPGWLTAVKVEDKVKLCGEFHHIPKNSFLYLLSLCVLSLRLCEVLLTMSPILSLLQPISRLPAAPQLWAVSNHTITVPLQPSTVAAAIFRYDLVFSNQKMCNVGGFKINLFYLFLRIISPKLIFFMYIGIEIRFTSPLKIIRWKAFRQWYLVSIKC